jgi:hypothetical protein
MATSLVFFFIRSSRLRERGLCGAMIREEHEEILTKELGTTHGGLGRNTN